MALSKPSNRPIAELEHEAVHHPNAEVRGRAQRELSIRRAREAELTLRPYARGRSV